MRSLLAQLSAAFDNIYSGWILWNLFLAFIPLALSVLLFRPKLASRPWFWGFLGITGVLGVVGFESRLRFIMDAQIQFFQAVLSGNLSALLKLFWLLAIAAIAILINVWLMRQNASSRTWRWWVVLVIFIAFLPNAPYLLTDIIHLIRGTSSGQIRIWVVALVFIPMHVASILLGFEAYVLSLINQGYYLKQKGIAHFILPAELLIHGLSAIGIYLGRFIRLNSWDLVVDPSSVFLITFNALTAKRPLAVILITFAILTVFYWIMKQITLGLKLRIHYARAGLDALE